ncbi:MAG: DUF4450 domain-containing protein [Bacteroidales bacterium]|nr:DUF4450 domain-containing protein [Bacteroidales bacterium]
MRSIYVIFLLVLVHTQLLGQSKGYWHDKERTLRYTPEGKDIVIVNGDKRFNRALYGSNTAFRIETGDVPEFGFFMPHMGGNLQLGLIQGDSNLWLNDAEYVKSIYRPGSRIYEIKDPILKEGEIRITVLPLGGIEGMIMKIDINNLPDNTKLVSVFGGANNKRFWRNGDLGVDDPEGFSLKSANCAGNKYSIQKNKFTLTYGQETKGGPRQIEGIFPLNAELKIASPYQMMTPSDVWGSSDEEDKPILLSQINLNQLNSYYVVIKNKDEHEIVYSDLFGLYNQAEKRRLAIESTLIVNTPDPYLTPLGGVISVAADGIWQNTCWQHGAVGWRMPLNGWRAAYVGDAIGWHDRARMHFDGYAASQVTNIEPSIPHPSQDKKLNLARAAKTWGTQMYSNGYITRNQYETTKMHHYDMNLVYIDELLWHFNWTGDLEYVRKMWPILKRHLAWEKRNFDPNDDGLYDAYACIWASDALMYNSGGVTYSSAYNYRSNKMAAKIARLIGENYKPYEEEAAKILKAINSNLWIEDKGWWAEYKDLMGNQLLHPNAGVWTVYHALDSEIHTLFQAYQATRYIDNEIPHISVKAKGLKDEGYEIISTTNWLPYSWSVNNVAFAEVAHTSLAYWQAGRVDKAYKLFKSAVLDGMYLGTSPGNIGQVSFYDAARGETYRDFGDPIGVYSRTLVQGLFGILPDALHNKLVIRPGFPMDWDSASISLSDVDFKFEKSGNKDIYQIENNFRKELSLDLCLYAQRDAIKSVHVNGKSHKWSLREGISFPQIVLECDYARSYLIEIEWSGNELESSEYSNCSVKGQEWTLTTNAHIEKVYDPQKVLTKMKKTTNKISAQTIGQVGHRTLFVQLKQGQMKWWQAVEIEMLEPVTVKHNPEKEVLDIVLINNRMKPIHGKIILNGEYEKSISLISNDKVSFDIPSDYVRMGTNLLQVIENDKLLYETKLINWNLKNSNPQYDVVNIDKQMNDSVSQIFKNEYLSPRSPYTTLQTPKQGIGEWCHPTLMANIDYSGIRKMAKNDLFTTPFGLPFRLTSSQAKPNIIFTSLWDNYPSQVEIPLSGRASQIYLLMAGSTNHMQSHIVNGTVTVYYKDGTTEVLNLINPETWAPIEQDFYLDNQAFSSKYPRFYRVSLKTGAVSRNLGDEMNIKSSEVYYRDLDGGAANILDLPLNSNKELEKLELKSVANEVVIGLMGATLLR